MSEISPRRRSLVILCAGIALCSSFAGTLFRHHPIGRVVWLIVIIAALIYAVMEFVKIRKEEG